MWDACGNAMPVATIKAAPSNSMVRRSWRGAMKPAVSVSSDEPSSAVVATTPISAGLKPIADR